jgi:hypothetical protein
LYGPFFGKIRMLLSGINPEEDQCCVGKGVEKRNQDINYLWLTLAQAGAILELRI